VPPILFPSLRYVQRKPCTNLASRVALSPERSNRASTWATSPRSPTWATSKPISMPMVCSWQTMHLSCADTNTISKRTKMRFHTTHVTYEFHRVLPNLFMSQWYVQCKPCTYLASRLALSPNRPNKAPLDPRHLGVPRVHLKQFMSLWYIWRKLSIYLAPTLTLSQKHIEMKFHMTLVTLEFYRVPPILFWAYDTLDANLHQSCIKSSTISKRTEPSFQFGPIT
jgi:hypothetical protein